eukprot:509523-Hanusia_phi.AAC.1
MLVSGTVLSCIPSDSQPEGCTGGEGRESVLQARVDVRTSDLVAKAKGPQQGPDRVNYFIPSP